METSLWHGTTKVAAKNIKQIGLVPDVGGFTQDAYGDEYADLLEPAVFATDKRSLQRALNAIISHVARLLNKTFHDVTDDEIKTYGALIKVGDERGFEKRQDDSESRYPQEAPMQAEPGDWFSLDNQGIEFVVTGNKMIDVFRKGKVWPRDFGPEEDKNKRQLLMQFYAKSNPGVKPPDVMKTTDDFMKKHPHKIDKMLWKGKGLYGV